MRIRIFTKIESICPCHTYNLSTKFWPNPSVFLRYPAHRQTEVKTKPPSTLVAEVRNNEDGGGKVGEQLIKKKIRTYKNPFSTRT